VSTPPVVIGRPTVEEVARFIRARTKDDQGNEVGTFDDATRPTDEQVEGHIDAAVALVGLRLPAIDTLTPELQAATSVVVALEAACQIEKSYWPEQVVTGRSPYQQLRSECDAALEALSEMAGGGEGSYGFANAPVASWTSLGGWCCCGEE
jgi:hypothetical protein